MIRYVAVLRRRPGTTVEEFLSAWLIEHQSLARALPHVRDVAFHPAVQMEGMVDSYDGIGHLDFDSVDDLRSSLASEHAATLRAHTATFADTESVVRVVVDVPDRSADGSASDPAAPSHGS